MAVSLSVLDSPELFADPFLSLLQFPICLSVKFARRKIGERLISLSDKGMIACQILSYGKYGMRGWGD
jgi:hypothetical protein